MFIIWGVSHRTSTIEQGDFYCPTCDSREEYDLKQNRPYFSLFFIPLIPMGGGQRYVECAGCGNAFNEDVFDYKPPTEGNRLMARMEDELQSGTSVEALKRKLTRQGMEEDEAEDRLLELCEDRPVRCRCGRRYHPSIRECIECGEEI